MLGRLDNASVESLAARKPLNGVLAEGGERADKRFWRGVDQLVQFRELKRTENVRRKKAAENEF